MVRAVTDRLGGGGILRRDEPTVDVLARARAGDREAVEALLERCLPAVTRWAHGRLPGLSRATLDTHDLVQDAAMHAIGHLDTFEPRHVAAMQAYLRKCVVHRIIDEVRKIRRRPEPVEIGTSDSDLPSHEQSPLEHAIAAETFERYRAALATLSVRDRELIVARVELLWPLRDIAERFGFATTDAARMAVTRALEKLRRSAGQISIPTS